MNQNEKPNKKPHYIVAEVAVSIHVSVQAPDGYEGMSDEDLMIHAAKKLPEMTEWKDACESLQLAVAFYRGTHKDAKATFTPLLGVSKIVEI